MANLQQIIDRVIEEAAGIANDANKSIVIDADLPVQSLFPRVLRHVFSRKARNGESLEDSMVVHTIAVTSGEGNLPATVLKEAFASASLQGVPFASYLPYTDYLRFKFSQTGQLDYFTVHNSKLLYKQAGTTSFTGNVYLKAVTVPALPATITDDIAVSAKILDDCITVLVALMRGEMRVADLIETND